MKRFVLMLGLVLILVGGGAGWFFFKKPSQASAAAITPPENPAENAIYVDLAPLVLPVIDGDHVEQVLQVTITVEVASQEAAEKVKDSKPRLTDAFIQDLYGAIDRNRLLDGKMVDVNSLRDELTKASATVLGQDGFRKILIQRIAQRML